MSDDSTKSDDKSLFLAEMAGVTPLKPDNKVRHRKKAVETPVHSDEEYTGVHLGYESSVFVFSHSLPGSSTFITLVS